MTTRAKQMIQDVALHDVRIINKTSLANQAFVLTIPRLAPFLPGQVIAVSTSADIPPRLFSLCSGMNDPYWEILFNVKSDGLLSPRLAERKEHDTLHISLPFGSFTEPAAPAWWIATGTGIAPFRSMLRSGLATTRNLVHGARKADGFYFANEFDAAMPSRYFRCCSKGDAPNAYSGRITDWLAAKDNLPLHANYMLCGSAEMVVQVRDILLQKNIPLQKIQSEIYF